MAVFGNLRARLKKRVQTSLDEPQWTVLVNGKGWLCPFCAHVGVEALPQDEKERVEAILDHLVDAPCPDVHLGEGPLRPLAELRREASFRELRRKVKKELGRNQAWQLVDQRRRWYCPFCGEATEIEVPDDGSMTEQVLRDLCIHVEGCRSYARGKGGEKPVEELRAAIKSANRERKLMDDVRRKLEGDPLWRQKDPKARWVCPFCSKVLEHVDLSTTVVMFENAPRLIAQHLLQPCEPWKQGKQPQRVTLGPSPRGTDRILRVEPQTPLKAQTNGKPARTFKELGSSGDFDLIDDPEVKKLTASSRGGAKRGSSVIKAAQPDSSASVEWRREIERELAAVRQQVPGGLEYSGSLEDTVQAEARDAARVAEELPGFELRVLVRPARPARGDFVEVVRLGQNHLGILAGGVSGEDPEGALVAAMARNLMRIHARTERDPAQVLRNVNAEVFQDLEARTFVAALYAVLDGTKRTITIARAGIAPPALINSRRQPPLTLLETEGMVMGIDKGPIFDRTIVARPIELVPGDLLVFATNGVVELKNRNRDELGLERFHQTLRRYGGHEAEYLTSKLGQFLEDYTKETEPAFDACLVAVKLIESAKAVAQTT